MDEYYTAQEMAAMFKVDVRTIYGLAHKRELPVVRVGWLYRFPKKDVDAMTEKKEQTCPKN